MNDIRRNELKEALDDFRARVSLRDKKLQESEEPRVLSDDKAVDEMAYNILTGLLNDKFESIANYNSIIASIKDQEVIDILREIVEEEYIHIGQLQKILLNKAPVENAEELVDQGSEEVETPVEESLSEGYNVTLEMDLIDQLDDDWQEANKILLDYKAKNPNYKPKDLTNELISKFFKEDPQTVGQEMKAACGNYVYEFLEGDDVAKTDSKFSDIIKDSDKRGWVSKPGAQNVVGEKLEESLEDEEIHDRLKDFQGMELIAEIRKVAKEKKKDFKELLKQEIVASEGEHAGEFRPDPDSDVYYLLNKNGAIEKFKGDKLIKTMIPQAFASDLEFAMIGKEEEKEA